jgi:hypothetical protein
VDRLWRGAIVEVFTLVRAQGQLNCGTRTLDEAAAPNQIVGVTRRITVVVGDTV